MDARGRENPNVRQYRYSEFCISRDSGDEREIDYHHYNTMTRDVALSMLYRKAPRNNNTTPATKNAIMKESAVNEMSGITFDLMPVISSDRE